MLGKIRHPPNFLDRTGQRYDRLTVIEYVGYGKQYKSIWKCKCDCGNITEVLGLHLQSGHTRSCGCLCDEARYKSGLASRQHQFRETIFEDINSPDKAYWLGFILADGTIRLLGNCLSIRLKESDRGHLEKLSLFLDIQSPLIPYHTYLKKYNREYHGYQLSVYSQRLYRTLIGIGITPRKSLHTKSIHNKIPPEYWHDYWRGLVDGDGCLNIDVRGHIGLSLVGDIDIIKCFVEFCNPHVNFIPQIREAGKIFTAGYHQKKASIISDILYANSITYLDRKYNLAMEFIAKYQNVSANTQLTLPSI